MSDKIPPRPWYVPDARVAAHDFTPCDANNEQIAGDDVLMSRETAEFIVRLANAEPEVVAALEESQHHLEWTYGTGDIELRDPRIAIDLVRVALAKVRWTPRGPAAYHDWYCRACDKGMVDQECEPGPSCPQCRGPVVDSARWQG